MKKDLLTHQNQFASDKKLDASSYDYLTGLMNMNGFFDAAEAEKKAIQEKDLFPVLLFVDLSNMKSFNHKFGFSEGNRLLQALANILARLFGEENCCRLGQDHFAVITVETDIEEKLERLFQDSLKINEGRNIPVRVGIYPFRIDDTAISLACDRAKFACDALRNTYISDFNYFDENLEEISEKNQYIVENLDHAMKEGWIKAYCQPIVRATNGRVCEEEALARWEDPIYGFLTPQVFIPALEEADLVYKLDLFIIDQVIQKIQYLEERGITAVPQSVNLSRSDFDACDIVEEIRSRVDEAGIDRSKLVIELTESMIGRDFDFMKEQTRRFRALGFAVWMDDFGSGYSTLNLLQSIEVDLIKFDMCFMQSFETGGSGRIILTELMKLAIGLGIDTVCEGVETEEEVEFLREIGCEKLQGYYYHKPVLFDVIIKQIEAGINIDAEEPEEAAYYDAIGRINLYDLAAIASEDHGNAQRYFDMIPMAILEIKGDRFEFIRSNRSYREFARKLIGRDLDKDDGTFTKQDDNYDTAFMKLVEQCSREKTRSFISEKMPDKTTVHSVVRWIADNPHTGASAMAIVVLAVADGVQETTYESIARALAADYFKLYYVNLETGQFIEYRSDVGMEELAIERHGEAFFDNIRTSARTLLYEEDVENFVFSFTKENILRSIRQQGTFTLSFRIMSNGKPVHASLRAMRMETDAQKIIIGINIIEEQAKLKEGYEREVISHAISGTEAERFGSASLNTVSYVVKSCVKLMETGDFVDHVQEVLQDLMETTQSDAVRILLLDPKKEEMSIFANASKGRFYEERANRIGALSYEMIAGWEKLTDEKNALMVKNEEDMKRLEEKAAPWVQTMRKDGVKKLCLIPLRRADRTLGYLYACNFSGEKTERTKEMVELLSFFLSSEIESYLFRKELEILSNYDELTGLKNRYAMLNRVKTIEKEEPEISLAVMTMDLNGLKRLNDTEGHFAGDALIIKTANFIRESLGEEDVYRIGGDEFIKAFPNISKEEFEKCVRTFLEEDLPESGVSLAVGPWWSETAEDVDSIFYNADQKMYADKKAYYERHPELKH